MKRFLNLNTLYIVVAIIALSALLIPRVVEIYKLQTYGINYYANDIENFHNKTYPIDGEYTIQIDITDVDNNNRKVLFEDGENEIYVSEVIAHNPKKYELFFRSNGSLSLGGAVIVSGVEHKNYKDGLISKLQATAKATYKGDTYKLSPSEYSGLTNSGVDEFGFYLELPDDIASDFEGMIDVTVTNLYINFWSKKSY